VRAIDENPGVTTESIPSEKLIEIGMELRAPRGIYLVHNFFIFSIKITVFSSIIKRQNFSHSSEEKLNSRPLKIDQVNAGICAQ
jgi:hypothetical protein